MLNNIIIFIIFFILMLILFYVSSIDLNKTQDKKSVRLTKALIYIFRFSQYLIIAYILLTFYQITYFIFNQGDFLPKVFGIVLNQKVTSIFDWGVGVILLLFIVGNVINFGMIEFVVLMLKDFLKEFSFNEQTVKRLKMISYLFVLRIFLAALIHFVSTSGFALSTEQLMIYGLMVVLIRIFSHAQSIQEDSDLSI